MDLVTVNLNYFVSETNEDDDDVDDNIDGLMMCEMYSCNVTATYYPSHETIEQYIKCTMKWVKMCVRACVRLCVFNKGF